MVATTKKIVLVTGGNSGIGFHACLNIAKQANYHVILTGRDAQRVHAAAEQVRVVASPSSTVEEGVLELSSLAAIEAYVTALKKRSDVPQIDTVLLNAGVGKKLKVPTYDGYESMFGVNHLGHFHLATLLREQTKRFVIVSSETHDPAEATHTPPPNVSDLEQLAFGYEPFDAFQAYTTSKLCNLLFMFEWLRRFPNGAEFIAYTPGFTPDTALSREQDMDVAALVESFKKNGVPVNTSEAAGMFMARLVMEDWAASDWKSGDYMRMERVHPPSAQAQGVDLACALWNKSEELVTRATGNKA